MTSIPAILIDKYKSGTRHLVYTTEPGTVPVMTKAGVVDAAYKAGEIILTDDAGNVIVGPIGLVDAFGLAERILEGDQRAATDPKALMAMAVAVVGFQITTAQLTAARERIAALRGTLEYILAQAQQGYPTVLSVIKANAKAALDDVWQQTVANTRNRIDGC